MKKIFILFIGLLFFMSCGKYVATVDHIVADNMRISDRLVKNEDADIDEMITPYREQLEAEMNEVLIVTEVDLVKGSPQSTMGNWFADLLMEEAQKMDSRVSFALQNRGGLRINSIRAGDITKGKVFELMPFDNFLVIMELQGSTLREFVTHMASDGGWPTSRELKVTQIGENIDILINGEEINDDSEYIIALPDYVANGGSDSKMLIEEHHESTGYMIRDILVNNLKEKGQRGETISAKIDDRFTIN